MMGGSANFTRCALEYLQSPELIKKYNYSGLVHLLPPNPRTQITYRGCVALCGTGNDWYGWSVSSSFITTWLLPILGTLLQAPFESNAFWRTIKAICRWVGSPMSSLSYILWNIKVSGKCALFVDMAIPYEDRSSDPDGDFASLRDSFYLLMNINEYEMKPFISLTKEAEGLLRVALFSKDLKIMGRRKSLRQMRKKLAGELRSNRRRGVVPVFVSTLWFLFSLGISIQSAFGYLGDNAQAHDLAIGLFMGWFPVSSDCDTTQALYMLIDIQVLILSSIVDRNPIASDDIRRKLNKLVDAVCESLQDEENRLEFARSFRDLPQSQQMAVWLDQIATQAQLIKHGYFTGFAGQGRVRFHYGAAHAILIDIEKAYVAAHGRGWLKDEHEARSSLVLGETERSFVWFDGRQLWQILSALAIVGGTTAGAFILSFYTPTVGLSCRSGGYVVFAVVAFGLLILEFVTWMYTSPVRNEKQWRRLSERLDRLGAPSTHPEATSKRSVVPRVLLGASKSVTRTLKRIRRLLPRVFKQKIENVCAASQRLTVRQWAEITVFQPVEAFNTVWLLYLFMAQTTGAFNNCACETSIWGGYSSGGYLDFTQWQHSDAPGIQKYWIIGTVISCVFMGLGIIYIVIEWCLQSHLSTEDYENAMRGLQMARRFRRSIAWMRYPVMLLVRLVDQVAGFARLRQTRETRDLVWTKYSTCRPSVGGIMVRLGSEMQTAPFHRVDDGAADDSQDVEKGRADAVATKSPP